MKDRESEKHCSPWNHTYLGSCVDQFLTRDTSPVFIAETQAYVSKGKNDQLPWMLYLPARTANMTVGTLNNESWSGSEDEISVIVDQTLPPVKQRRRTGTEIIGCCILDVLIGAFASGNRSRSGSISEHDNHRTKECEKPDGGFGHFVYRVKEKTKGGVEYLRKVKCDEFVS